MGHRANSPGRIHELDEAGVTRVEIDVRADTTGRLIAAHDPADEGVPLDEVLGAAAESGLAVTIDLKCPAAAIPALCDAVASAGLAERTLFSGHYERPWDEIRSLLPSALRGWSPPEPGRWERHFRCRALQRELAAAAPALLGALRLDALLAHHSLVSDPLVRALYADGKLLHAWTVNRAGRARRLARMGVDAIVTGRPREIAAGLSSS